MKKVYEPFRSTFKDGVLTIKSVRYFENLKDLSLKWVLSQNGEAVADGEISSKNKNNYQEKDITNLNFVGLVAFIDPVREEVIESISECHKAGIKVVMITGDNADTATAIYFQLFSFAKRNASIF